MTENPLPWLRLNCDFVSDPRIQRLPEVMQRRYVCVLCLAGQRHVPTADDAEIAFALRLSRKEIAKTKTTLIAADLIDSTWLPVDFQRFAKPYDHNGFERMRRYRENRDREKHGASDGNGDGDSDGNSDSHVTVDVTDYVRTYERTDGRLRTDGRTEVRTDVQSAQANGALQGAPPARKPGPDPDPESDPDPDPQTPDEESDMQSRNRQPHDQDRYEHDLVRMAEQNILDCPRRPDETERDWIARLERANDRRLEELERS